MPLLLLTRLQKQLLTLLKMLVPLRQKPKTLLMPLTKQQTVTLTKSHLDIAEELSTVGLAEHSGAYGF